MSIADHMNLDPVQMAIVKAAQTQHTDIPVDSDPAFTIDPVTRKIINHCGKKTLVQYDHNCESLSFEIPLIVEGHDMSTCNQINIHYLIGEHGGMSEAEDIVTVDDKLRFAWHIKSGVTAFMGKLNFAISMRCVDTDGKVKYSFGTDICSEITVIPSYNFSAEIVEENADILQQWKDDLFGVMGDVETYKNASLEEIATAKQTSLEEITAEGNEQVEAVQQEGVVQIANIQAEADNYIDYEKANALAIKQTASGRSIHAEDSAEWPVMGMNVYGRTEQVKTTGAQLFDIDRLKETTVLVSDSCGWISATVENTTNETRYVNYFTEKSDLLLPNTEYLIVLEVLENPGDLQICAVSTDLTNKNNQQFTETIASRTSFVKIVRTIEDFSNCSYMLRSFVTIPANTPKTRIKFRISLIADITKTFDDFVYEPYTGGKPSPSPEYPQELVIVGDGGNVAVDVYGKNILPHPMLDNESSGITFTVKENGNIEAHGTSTGISQYYMAGTLDSKEPCLILRKGIAYTNIANRELRYQTTKGSYSYIGIGKTTLPAEDVYICSLWYQFSDKTGTNVNVTVENPAFIIGDATSQFEPYKPVQPLAIPTPNGLPGIPVSSGGNYTDENGQEYICDEVCCKDGQWGILRRVGQGVIDESQSACIGVGKNSDGSYCAWNNFYSDVIKRNSYIMSNVLPHMNIIDTTNFGIRVSELSIILYMKEIISSDKNLFITYLSDNPIEIVYELAEPVFEPFTAETVAAIKALHTNKPVTNIFNDADAHMALTYAADPVTYMENQRTAIMDEVDGKLADIMALLPASTQAAMIENDTANLLTESEEL